MLVPTENTSKTIIVFSLYVFILGNNKLKARNITESHVVVKMLVVRKAICSAYQKHLCLASDDLKVVWANPSDYAFKASSK